MRHIIPRPFSFPADPHGPLAAEETSVQLSELLTLPVLMKHSITAPLVSQYVSGRGICLTVQGLLEGVSAGKNLCRSILER